MTRTLDAATHLGAARVVRTAGPKLQLELPDAFVWAQSALAFPYQPAVDDEVLVIGQGGAWYVIGVIAGRGAMSITVPGDLTLQAPNGRIDIVAKDGVALKGRVITITAQRFNCLARTVVERFGRLTTWVVDTLQTRAGRLRSRIAGDYDLKAGRIREIADAEVKIDGSRIHLG